MQKNVIQTIIFLLCMLLLAGCGGGSDASSDADVDDTAAALDFNGPVSRAVLDAYLSRAVTMSDLLRPDSFFADYGFYGVFARQLDFIAAVRPLFIGRAMLVWAMESMFTAHMSGIEDRVAHIHAIDDRIIVQGAIFEAVSTEVETISIPAFVFEAFGLTPESRPFSYAAMLFADQKDQFGPGISVPDISQLETRLWYYYVAVCFIDAGLEAIHLGQLDWVSEDDADKADTADLIARIRGYAETYARRGWVLLDAHTHGLKRGSDLLLDFHSSPLRLYLSDAASTGVDISPQWPPPTSTASTSIYGRSLGGRNPGGWTTNANPYLVEFDHGYSQGSVDQNTGPEFIEGLDEITWLSVQSTTDQSTILQYLQTRVQQIDAAGHLQPAAMRPIWTNHVEQADTWYFACAPDNDFPWGADQEAVIAALWGAVEE